MQSRNSHSVLNKTDNLRTVQAEADKRVNYFNYGDNYNVTYQNIIISDRPEIPKNTNTHSDVKLQNFLNANMDHTKNFESCSNPKFVAQGKKKFKRFTQINP